MNHSLHRDCAPFAGNQVDIPWAASRRQPLPLLWNDRAFLWSKQSNEAAITSKQHREAF